MLTDEQLERNDVVDNTAFALLNEAHKLKRFVNVFNSDFDTTLDEIYFGFGVTLTAEERELIRNEAVKLASEMEWDAEENSLVWDMYFIAELLDTIEGHVPEEKQLAFRPFTEDDEED